MSSKWRWRWRQSTQLHCNNDNNIWVEQFSLSASQFNSHTHTQRQQYSFNVLFRPLHCIKKREMRSFFYAYCARFHCINRPKSLCNYTEEKETMKLLTVYSVLHAAVDWHDTHSPVSLNPTVARGTLRTHKFSWIIPQFESVKGTIKMFKCYVSIKFAIKLKKKKIRRNNAPIAPKMCLRCFAAKLFFSVLNNMHFISINSEFYEWDSKRGATIHFHFSAA